MLHRTIQESRGDRLFNAANYAILSCVTLSVLYPLVYVVSASFSSPYAVMSGQVWLWPVDLSLAGYEAVFNNGRVWSGFANSLFYTVAGTFINVVLTIMAAYPLSRKDLVGRGFFMFLFVFTMMFNGGLIPTFLLVKDLGLLDTRAVMLMITAMSVWHMIIARTYFQVTIPKELNEAAEVDGCGNLRFLWSVVLPVSGPILAVIALFYAVGHWNQFFNALIFLNDPDKFPLQIVLRDILVQNEVDLASITDVQDLIAREGLKELLKYSLIVVATVPLMIVYPFVQKHFVKGVMIGSLKG